MGVQSYRDLTIWQKSIILVKAVYSATQDFLETELYGLTAQMRRAAVSIASNIAEGSRRGSRKDFRNFLLNAYESGAELETQCEIAKQLSFLAEERYKEIEKVLTEVMRMLNGTVRSLTEIKSTHYSLPTTHS